MKFVIGLILISLIFIAGCSKSGYSNEQLDSLANCLVTNNVKEYGAFWCPNCAQQEKMFGSSHKILRDKNVYIECDPRCVRDSDGDLPAACRGVEGKAEECLANNIDRYPTWVFDDNTRLIGTQELSVLAQKTGCSL